MLIWFLFIRPTWVSISGNILACRWKLAWLVQDFSLLLSLLKTHCSSYHCLRAYSSTQLLLFLDTTIKGSGYHKYSFIIIYVNMFSYNFDSYMEHVATSNIRYIIFLKMDNCFPYSKTLFCIIKHTSLIHNTYVLLYSLLCVGLSFHLTPFTLWLKTVLLHFLDSRVVDVCLLQWSFYLAKEFQVKILFYFIRTFNMLSYHLPLYTNSIKNHALSLVFVALYAFWFLFLIVFK